MNGLPDGRRCMQTFVLSVVLNLVRGGGIRMEGLLSRDCGIWLNIERHPPPPHCPERSRSVEEEGLEICGQNFVGVESLKYTVKDSFCTHRLLKCKNVNCSVVSNSVTPWTVAHQAPLCMEFSRQEYWSG